MEASEVTDPKFWSGPESRVFAPPRLAEEGAAIEGLLAGEDSVVFASSGSGGVPKWTRFLRKSLLASAKAVNRHLEVTAGDRWMLPLPLFHVGGFGIAARAYLGGCHLRQFAGRWNAMRFADELEEDGSTLTSLVPTQVHDVVACELRAPTSLRAVVVGGARLDEVSGQAARDLGWPVLQSYGMTEAASQVATDSLDNLGTEFRTAPLPILSSWEHRVSEDGCLQLRGESLMDCYLHLESGSLREERPIDDSGWFVTTDRVEISPEGLTVIGRLDRQVKILGELVDVQAVEEELREHLPRGVGVYILHLPDERRGWRLHPVIESGATAAEDVVEFVNERLPGFARLEAPRSVMELPRTALGKVDVAVLRNEFGASSI